MNFSGSFAAHDPIRGWARRYSKCHGSGRVETPSVKNITGRIVSGQEVFKSRGSGQVGSRVWQISRVGSGLVRWKPKDRLQQLDGCPSRGTETERYRRQTDILFIYF